MKRQLLLMVGMVALLALLGITQASEPRLSIDVQEASISGLLHQLAQHKSYNLVVDQDVAGDITVNLQQVTWQQALDTVLNLAQLQAKKMGNTLYIAPRSHFIELQQHQLSAHEYALQHTPLTTEVIAIHYADVAVLHETLNQQGGVGLLSQRGSLRFDERTSSLIIHDRPDVITRFEALVKQLDIPVEQVRIEARIVTINEDNLDELGVRWGLTKRRGDLILAPNVDALYPDTSSEGANGQNSPQFNVNLAVASDNAASIGFQLGNLGRDFLLDLELSALQSESKAEIIATPRLLTMDKQPAYIEQGTEIPYLAAASSGATSVEFKKAVLSLTVTPHITPDKQLILVLDMTQDTQGTVVKTGEGEAVAINTQRISTRVLVNNGETLVLGGIIQQLTNQGVDKVPLLADIPVVGHLFKREYQQSRKQELLIFVTPNIVTPNTVTPNIVTPNTVISSTASP
ncbi:type IV pilus secretin PilQ [Vibrio hippocampi]|nr:type IV pilus secretin PilQ [Vibrio hippocampi]